MCTNVELPTFDSGDWAEKIKVGYWLPKRITLRDHSTTPLVCVNETVHVGASIILVSVGFTLSSLHGTFGGRNLCCDQTFIIV